MSDSVGKDDSDQRLTDSKQIECIKTANNWQKDAFLHGRTSKPPKNKYNMKLCPATEL